LWWKILRERFLLENVAIDGRIILEWILKEIGWEIVDWSDLAQETDQTRAV
jgi:hypothetical protein